MPELSDDIKEILNQWFAKNNIPTKVNYLVLYRPVFHQPPFEDVEIFNDAKRIAACDALYMVITIEHNNRKYESELRYKNVKGKFENTLCQLMYGDILPEEDLDKLQQSISEIFKFIGLLIIACLEHFAKKE